jgi:hypothetical protein
MVTAARGSLLPAAVNSGRFSVIASEAIQRKHRFAWLLDRRGVAKPG